MRTIISILSFLLIVSACNKIEPINTREDELRNGKWKHSAMTLRHDPYIGKDTVYNLYDSLPVWPVCKKDNYIMFGNNYNAVQNVGDDRCDDSEPQSIAFRWSLENDKETLHLWNAGNTFFGKETISAPIEEYSPDRFTISYLELINSPVNSNHKDTFTYTHTFTRF